MALNLERLGGQVESALISSTRHLSITEQLNQTKLINTKHRSIVKYP